MNRPPDPPAPASRPDEARPRPAWEAYAAPRPGAPAQDGMPASTSAEPADGADGADAPAPRGVGCSWPVLVILLALIGLIAGGWWGVRWVSQRNMIGRLRMTFPEASLLPATRLEPAPSDQQVHLYYIVRGRLLAPQTRQLARTAGESERAHLIAKTLADPPPSDLYESPIPPGVKIRGVYLIDGIIWLDLSAEFLTQEGATPLREQLVIYGIVNSFLLNDKMAQGLRFMVDGKPIQSAWGWMDLSSPLSANLIE